MGETSAAHLPQARDLGVVAEPLLAHQPLKLDRQRHQPAHARNAPFPKTEGAARTTAVR
jgi:hypothetical protein